MSDLASARTDRALLAAPAELRALVDAVRAELAAEQRQGARHIIIALASPLGPLERAWTVEDAAAYLDLEREDVRRLARAGKLQALGKVSGAWRFSPADVRALLRRGRSA